MSQPLETVGPETAWTESLSDPPPERSFAEVRLASERLVAHLEPADFEAQSAPECSPLKWHLAHTTWFFETFVLQSFEPNFQPFHDQFSYLFNSYYNAIGERQPRGERGLLSRPSLQLVREYRTCVTERVQELLLGGDLDELRRQQVLELIELGCHHEQQHQELMLTDVLHLFSRNPLHPAYSQLSRSEQSSGELGFISIPAGLYEVGHGGSGFAFDNERPRHRVFLEAFDVADRLVTNAEFAAFIADGGYRRPALWLDEGFAMATRLGWDNPLYFRGEAGDYQEFTLGGLVPLEPERPVCHISFYEADAYARWAGARLLREQEWEVAAIRYGQPGTCVEDAAFRPCAAFRGSGMRQCFGDTWEWTQSAYAPYPGYRAPAGALGEYNGKFMVGQIVLRGGSCATPRSHLRPTYRNFFHPQDRWQFSGIRLAKDTENAF